MKITRDTIEKFTLIWTRGLCVTAVGLFLAACSSPSHPVSPLSPLETTSAPSVDLPTESEGLPPETQLIGAQYSGDFGGDGQLEIISSYSRADGGGGIIVNDILDSGYSTVWQEEIPDELSPSDFSMFDLDQDQTPELVLFAHDDEAIEHYVFIYYRDGDTYVMRNPVGGPLDGESAFLSLYWPPILDDVDFNEITEIIVFTENTNNPEALSAAVYEWNGSEFNHNPIYTIPPRFKPTDSQ